MPTIWHFHIISRENFHAQLSLTRKKKLQLLVVSDLLAGQNSCSAELSMKKSFITSGLGLHIWS